MMAALLLGACTRVPPQQHPYETAVTTDDGASAHLSTTGAQLFLGAHRIGIGVVGIGRERITPTPAGRVTRDDDGARRDLGNQWMEWWRRAPGGLEHGVTFAHRPIGAGPLRIDLEVTGAELRVVADDAAQFRDGAQVVAAYSALTVRDADGTRIPARMIDREGGLRIEVDDDAARYPLVVDPIVAVQEAMLASDVPTYGRAVGTSVSMSSDGSLLLVGAPYETVSGGAVWVYRRAGSVWTLEATLTATPPIPLGSFGSDLRISGDGTRAIICAVSERPVAGDPPGRAHIFRRTGTAWTEEQVLGGGAVAVAISDDGSRVAVGSPYETVGGLQNGAVHMYARTGTTWIPDGTLTTGGPTCCDRFGNGVSLAGTGDRMLAAVIADSGATTARGAWVYTRGSGAWVREATLNVTAAPGGVTGAAPVALDRDGTHAYVRTYQQAHTFVRTGTTWTDEGSAARGVGVFAADGTRLFLGEGTATASGATQAGQVSLYVRGPAGGFVLDGTFSAPDAAMNDALGSSLAVSSAGGRVVAGAPGDTVSTLAGAGSARVFRLQFSNGARCDTDDSCSSGFCTDGVCCTTRCGGAGDCQGCSAALTGGADGVCGALGVGAASATVCRASTDACDAAEICVAGSTTCPVDLPATAGTGCRASTGACDVAETCDGITAACPADGVRAAGSVCRTPATTCDAAELCDGVAVTCPVDVVAVSGTVCRAEAGPCDSAEVCNGSSSICPGDTFEPAGSLCGMGMGDCATPGTCSGLTSACSSTGVRPNGTLCRTAAGPCDADDHCDGTSPMCPDVFAPVTDPCGGPTTGVCDARDHCAGTTNTCVPVFATGVECRAASGACDVAESCNGTSADCPSDTLIAGGIPCRVSTGASCDPQEACDGVAATCPADVNRCVDASPQADAASATDGGSAGGADAGSPPTPASSCGCALGARGRAGTAVIAILVALLLSRRRIRGGISARSGASGWKAR